MKPDKTLWDIYLYKVAVVLWVLCVLLGLIAVSLRCHRYVLAQARIDDIDEQLSSLKLDNDRERDKLASLDMRIERATDEIALELKRRKVLEMHMAEVLARAKMVQQERDKFRVLREEIRRRLREMDNYYKRVRE